MSYDVDVFIEQMKHAIPKVVFLRARSPLFTNMRGTEITIKTRAMTTTPEATIDDVVIEFQREISKFMDIIAVWVYAIDTYNVMDEHLNVSQRYKLSYAIEQ